MNIQGEGKHHKIHGGARTTTPHMSLCTPSFRLPHHPQWCDRHPFICMSKQAAASSHISAHRKMAEYEESASSNSIKGSKPNADATPLLSKRPETSTPLDTSERGAYRLVRDICSFRVNPMWPDLYQVDYLQVLCRFAAGYNSRQRRTANIGTELALSWLPTLFSRQSRSGWLSAPLTSKGQADGGPFPG